jgi:hypothetical protein
MAALVKPGAGATERQWRAYEEAKALQDYEAKEAQRRAQSAVAPAQPAAVAAPAPARAIPNVQPTHTQGRGLMNALKVLKTRSGGY